MINVGRDRTYSLLLIAGLITLLLIPSHQFLPERQFVLYPDSALPKDLIFADGQRGGNSTVAWGNEPGEFFCDIKDGPIWKMCGLHIPLGDARRFGMDLSPYTHMLLDIDYEGPTEKLRFYIRSFEEGFSDPDEYESNKFSNVIIPAEEYSPPWRVSLKLFTVADWWKHDKNVPLENTMPDFEQAIMMGVDLAYPVNGIHRLKVNNIILKGPLLTQARWYQLILSTWAAILFVLAIKRYYDMKRRLKADADRLTRLKTYSRELKEKGEHYYELSQRDNLTGVLNRYGIEQALEQLYPQGKSAIPHSLLVLDIDHFKAINDDLGHKRGDEILHQLCRTLLASIRDEDTLGRWGGEEFVLICPGLTSHSAADLADRLRRQIETIVVDTETARHLTISVGLTESKDGESFDMVFERADNALYRAKHQGRNVVEVN